MPEKLLCSHKLCFRVFVDEGYEVPGFCYECDEAFCEQHLTFEAIGEPICSACEQAIIEGDA